jgi:hypothetical protein
VATVLSSNIDFYQSGPLAMWHRLKVADSVFHLGLLCSCREPFAESGGAGGLCVDATQRADFYRHRAVRQRFFRMPREAFLRARRTPGVTCVDGVNMAIAPADPAGHSSSNSEMYREIRQIADLVNGRPTISLRLVHHLARRLNVRSITSASSSFSEPRVARRIALLDQLHPSAFWKDRERPHRALRSRAVSDIRFTG